MELNCSLITIMSALGSCSLSEPKALDFFVVNRLTSLETAGPGDMAVVLDRGDASSFDAVSNESLLKSKAGLFLATRVVVPGKLYLLVDNVSAALHKLVAVGLNRSERLFEHDDRYPHCSVSVHAHIGEHVVISPGVVIESGARIGPGTRIASNSVIEAEAIVGSNVVINAGVVVGSRCRLGDRSIIHAGTVIGSDGFGYQVTKQGFSKIPHVGIVDIGCDVEIGAQCTLDRAVFDATLVGDGVKIDNLVHIAHNVVIGSHTAILAQTGVAGSVCIGRGCQIGGQVAIKDHVVIGDGAKIVSKSAVMHNVEPGAIVCGIPAQPFTRWKRMIVAMAKLPELYKQTR